MQNSLKLTLNKSMTASLQWNSTWHQLMLFAAILPSLLLEVLPFLFSSVVRSNSLRFMVHVARVVLGRTHICHTTLPRFSSSSLFRWEAHLFQQQQLVWVCPPTANRNPQSIPINGIFFASLQTTNQKLTRFIPSQLRSSKPRSRYWWCFINQATRKWQVNFMLNFASWQLLEDRLPRENHESKKNCTVILFVGRGGIQPFPGNYQKNTCCHLRGIFACHLNSRMIIHIILYNIIIHLLPVLADTFAYKFTGNRHLSTLQANFVEHPCLLTIHCKTVHGEQAPEAGPPVLSENWWLSTHTLELTGRERRKLLVDSDDHFLLGSFGLFSGTCAV